jgi:hypothetical protein
MSVAAAPFGSGVKDGMVRASADLAAQVTCILGAVISGLLGMRGATYGELTPGIITAFASSEAWRSSSSCRSPSSA